MSYSYFPKNSEPRINDHKTLLFLDLYEKERCLWDTTLEDYKIKSKKREAAKRIAKALNLKDFNSKHVPIKFKHLRDSYIWELEKIASSEAAGDDPVYCPTVFWFLKMEFIRPHLQSYEEQNNGEEKSYFEDEKEEVHVVKVKHNGIFSYDDEVAPYGPPENRSASLSTASRTSVEENYDTSISQPLGDNLSQPSIYSTQQQEVRPRSSEYSKSLVKRVSTYRNTSRATPRVDDCFDSFGNYVASMLKNIPFQRAMSLQPEIVKLLISGMSDNNEGPSNRSDMNGNSL